MIFLIAYCLLSLILSIHWIANKNEYRSRLMVFPIAPLIIAAGSALYQGIKGAKQKREARRLQEDADRRDASDLAEARRMALVGMPEAEYRKALESIYRNQGATLSALKDRRLALAGATSVQQSTNDALSSLAAQDAKMRQQNQYNALNRSARSTALLADRSAQQRASGEALTGAAMQNIFNTAGYAAMMAGDGGEGRSGGGNGMSGAFSGFKPLNSSLFGKGGYRGGLGYSKPY